MTDDLTPAAGADQFSLADINVSFPSSGGFLPTVGPGFLDHESTLGEDTESDKKGKAKKKTNNKGRGRRLMRSKILQEAIGSLYPDVEDPGEAMRLARAVLKQGGEEEFMTGETSTTVVPGREKILPGNDHDDLPVFIMGIVNFIIKPEMEKARYAAAKRKGDDGYMFVSDQKRSTDLRNRLRMGVGTSVVSSSPLSYGGSVEEGSGYDAFQFAFGETKH